MKRLILALVVLTCMALPAQATDYTPRVLLDSLGTNAQFMNDVLVPVPPAPALTTAQKNDLLDAIVGQKIRNIRIGIPWRWAQNDSGNETECVHAYHWGSIDPYFTMTAAKNIRVAPVLAGSPSCATITNDQTGKEPPQDPADFAAFAKAFAQRYGASGSFWSENSSLPYLPVLTYEIWNEPNVWGHFKVVGTMCPMHTVGVDQGPKVYADLFGPAYTAIHEAQSAAVVMIGGLTGKILSDVTGDPLTNKPGSDICTVKEFLQGMKQHRPSVTADAIGIHMYRAALSDVFSKFETIRQEMDSLGWPAALPIYLNENGWSEKPTPTATYASRDATRGTNISTVADRMLRSKCGVRQYSVHTWVTPESQGYPGGDPSTIENNGENWYGIANWDGTLKTSAATYGSMVSKLQGETAGANFAVDGLCSWRAMPDMDGDGYLDNVDAYPADAAQH